MNTGYNPFAAALQVAPGERYLRNRLGAIAVDTGPSSPLRGLQIALMPVLNKWGNGQIAYVTPSGSFAKGTAVYSGTDLDLFISLYPDTRESLKEVHDKLFKALTLAGYVPKRKNTAIGIKVQGFDVDLVLGKQQDWGSEDHSLFWKKSGTWKKTNVATHIAHVRGSDLLDEIRLFKLWRDRLGLDFPSFYLELTLMAALPIPWLYPKLEDRIQTALAYIRDNILTATVRDPANTNNVLSDELTFAEKNAIRLASKAAYDSNTWGDFVG